MEIKKVKNGTTLNIALEGRLDTVTSPELETMLGQNLPGLTELNFDFAKLEYITSAGLRVLLSTQKTMNKQGKMSIMNVNKEILDIFEITGFSDILNIVG